MKQFLTLIFIIISINSFGQNEFPKDTINNFSLNLQVEIFLPMSQMTTTIDINGNVRCTYYRSNHKLQRRDTISDKRIKLDYNTYRQIKENIIMMGLDTLQAKYDDQYTSDGAYYDLKIEYNDRKINLQGKNRDSSDPAFKKLITYLENLIGIIAVDYENH